MRYLSANFSAAPCGVRYFGGHLNLTLLSSMSISHAHNQLFC